MKVNKVKLPNNGMIKIYSTRLGCDPEFFIEMEGKIDGSEKIIPEKGLKNGAGYGKVKRDGVQCELNPRPMYCRAYLHNEIKSCFTVLNKNIQGYKVNGSTVIKMDKKTLDKLSAEARKFGCMPSKNAYTEHDNKINVSASKYLYRSAGGHIHVGKNEDYDLSSAKLVFDDIPTLVKLFDVFVGSIGVILDRDIWAKKRREVYGKAGDYRTPDHGFEYRTLSNFWLHDYLYMSLMFGLARTACEFKRNDLHKQILNLVDDLDVQTIINNNDINGALEVWNRLEHVFLQLPGSDHWPLNSTTTKFFAKFMLKPYKPLGKDDLINYWIKRPEGHTGGFMDTIIKMERR